MKFEEAHHIRNDRKKMVNQMQFNNHSYEERHMVSIFLLKLNYRFRTGWWSKAISYVAIQYSLPFFLSPNISDKSRV